MTTRIEVAALAVILMKGIINRHLDVQHIKECVSRRANDLCQQIPG